MRAKKEKRLKRFTVHYYDEYDYRLASRSAVMYSIIHDTYQYLRGKSKYEGKNTDVYEEFIKMLNEYSFDIFE